MANLDFGQKSEEYPYGYGYCQCGCGKLARKLTNGDPLRYFNISHHPERKKKVVERQRLRYIQHRERMRKERKHMEQKKIASSFVELVEIIDNRKWAKKFDKCIGCGTVKIPHLAKGYCKNCYHKFIVRKTGSFNRDNKEVYSVYIKDLSSKVSNALKKKDQMKKQFQISEIISEVLDKKLLVELYHNQQKSLQDIANIYQCSRVYIYKLCKKYGIEFKTKSRARGDAYSIGKKINFHPINTNFFKKWTDEMAYVLGVIYTDGNLPKALNQFSISQKKSEILEKIKKFMQAEQNIVRYKCQDIYHLIIGSKEMVDDLLKLGLTPAKSLTIKFPEVPDEYVGGFIRGIFDGDGSIRQRHNSYTVSFMSASVNFMHIIKNKLEILADVSSNKLYNRFTTACTPYYVLQYGKKDDIMKLFNFMYNTYSIDNEIYLTRKFLKFKEAIATYNNQKILNNGEKGL